MLKKYGVGLVLFGFVLFYSVQARADYLDLSADLGFSVPMATNISSDFLGSGTCLDLTGALKLTSKTSVGFSLKVYNYLVDFFIPSLVVRQSFGNLKIKGLEIFGEVGLGYPKGSFLGFSLGNRNLFWEVLGGGRFYITRNIFLQGESGLSYFMPLGSNEISLLALTFLVGGGVNF